MIDENLDLPSALLSDNLDEQNFAVGALAQVGDLAQQGNPTALAALQDERWQLAVHVASLAAHAVSEGVDLDIPRYLEALEMNDYDPELAAVDYDSADDIEAMVEQHIDRGVAEGLANPTVTPGRYADGRPTAIPVTGRPADTERGEISASKVGSLDHAILDLHLDTQEKAEIDREVEQSDKAWTRGQPKESLDSAINGFFEDRAQRGAIEKAAAQGVAPRPEDNF